MNSSTAGRLGESVRRRRRWNDARRSKETIAKCVLAAITLSLVVPVVAILGYLVVKAWPVLGLSFLLENPKDYMTAGGIWAPLVGTFFLVLISLLVAAPIGILAGVYLNEYAGDNWATRIINLAVMNLAGVPSIVHALFGVGAFVLFAGMGRSLLAASCTLAVMTLPVIITSTREALGLGADVVPRGLLEHGRHPLADDPHHRAAQLDQRHPHRRDPCRCRGRPAKRRRSSSPGRSSSRPWPTTAGSRSSPTGWATAAWPCRCTCSRWPRRSAAFPTKFNTARPSC